MCNNRSLIIIIFHYHLTWDNDIFLSIIFMVGGSKACIASTDITGLRNPTRNCVNFPLLYANQFFKTCPSASSSQQQIQLVVVLIFSELKLSHFVIFDIICISEGTPMIYVLFCVCRFIFVRFIIPCNFWEYIVLSVMGHLAVTSSR